MLKIKNLSKSFNEKIIFDNFSYDFGDCGLYVIKGASGIGKTTLLRMIAGLDRDFIGDITGGGIGNVSFMFQEYRLFPTVNAIDNVMISIQGEHPRNDAIRLLSSLGISEEDALKKPKELSGGMKQRVAFARAVMMSAPILIRDEPTKELDEISIKRMSEIIAEEAKRRLVIIVTHDDPCLISEDSTLINL